jgi:DNA (cytosine-5)-methyltransferase 1
MRPSQVGGHQALTVPPGAFIQKHHGGLDHTATGHMTKSVDEPLPGIVARPNLSLVIPHRKGNVKTTDEPLHTVATRIGRPGRGRRDRCRRLPVSSAQTA